MRISKLKQRLTAIAAAAALAVTALAPAPAWAVGNVAKIGDVEYPTLEQAISQANNGDVVQLIDNAAVFSLIEIKDKSIELDLQQKSVTGLGTKGVLLVKSENAPATVKVCNGNIAAMTGINYVASAYGSEAKLVLDDVEVLAQGINDGQFCINAWSGSSISIENGSNIRGGNGGGINATGGSVVVGNSNVAVEKGSGKNHSAFLVGGSSESSLTIKGGTFSSEDIAISIDTGLGNLVIEGGTFSAKTVLRDWGTPKIEATISGGTFNGDIDLPNGAKPVISAGTFTDKDDASRYLAPGCSIDEQGNVSSAPAQTTSGFCGGDESVEGHKYTAGDKSVTVRKNLTWKVEENSDVPGTYTLKIEGTGPMANFEYVSGEHPSTAPWLWTGWADKITKVEVAEGVTTLGEHALRGLAVATELSLPASMANVRPSALLDNPKLNDIYVAEGNTNYATDEHHNLYNKNMTELVRIPEGTTLTSYTAPASLTKVGDYSARKTGIVSFDFSQAKVAEFGQEALSNSMACTSIAFSSVPSLKVGYSALADLPYIELPAATKALEVNCYGFKSERSTGIDISHVDKLTLTMPSWLANSSFHDGAYSFAGADYLYVKSEAIAKQITSAIAQQPDQSIAAPVIAVVGEGTIDFDPVSVEIATPVSSDEDKLFAGWKDASGNVVTAFTPGEIYTANYADPVAEIDGTGYITLQDAIDAAKDGETVKLIRGIKTSSSVQLNGNKSITLDLNGCTVDFTTADNSALHGFYVAAAGLTITDTSTDEAGKIRAMEAQSRGIVLKGDATVVLEKGNIEAAYVGISIGGQVPNQRLEIKGGAIASENGVLALSNGTAGNTVVEMSGGTINGRNAGILSNGTLTYAGVNIAISGGTITATNKSCSGLYLPAASSVTIITGGTITGANGIEVRAGSLSVSGDAVIEGVGDFSATPNASGGTLTGAGIAVAQHATRQPIELTVSDDAQVSGHYAFYEWNAQGNLAEDLAKIELALKGGQFKATGSNIDSSVYSENFSDFITGGSFKPAPEAKYIADGCGLLKSDADGNYVVHQHDWLDAFESNKDEHWHKCAKCDAKHEVEQHEGELVNAKPATCGEDGYTGDTVCGICEYVLAKGKVVPATGKHGWSDWSVTKKPACAAEGEESRTCSVCKKVETKPIPATGEHEFSDGWTAGPDSHWHACETCGAKSGEAGHEGGEWEHNSTDHWRTCGACGGAYAISAHEFGDWKVTEEPTATEPGEREHACETCGKVVSEEIPALGEKPADKPGSKPGKPGEGEPEGDKLAQTGDDSMLPIAIAGGVGVAAVAAGVVVAIKRRK